jgi:hypothetical protein
LENAVTLYMESGSQPISNARPAENDVQFLEERPRPPVEPRREQILGDYTEIGFGLPEDVPSDMDPFAGDLQENQNVGTDRVWQNDDRLANLFAPPIDIMFKGTFQRVKQY